MLLRPLLPFRLASQGGGTSSSRFVSRTSSRATSQLVRLNYQEPPPPGKVTGRYINQPDKGDVSDVSVACEVTMCSGRAITPPATLDTMGFSLATCATRCKDFRNDDEVRLPTS